MNGKYRLAIFTAGTPAIKRINQDVGIDQVDIILDFLMQEMPIIQQLPTRTYILTASIDMNSPFTMRAGNLHSTIR